VVGPAVCPPPEDCATCGGERNLDALYLAEAGLAATEAQVRSLEASVREATARAEAAEARLAELEAENEALVGHTAITEAGTQATLRASLRARITELEAENRRLRESVTGQVCCPESLSGVGPATARFEGGDDGE